MDAVVFISYPGHCLSTLATIKNLYSLVNWDAPKYIIIDDLGYPWKQWGWTKYVDDYKDLLELNFPGEDFNFKFFSEFEFDAVRRNGDGWMRQQYVKLNLDRVIPGDLWYVLDGDVELESPPEFDAVPYSYTTKDSHPGNIQRTNYIRFMLGTDDPYVRIPTGETVNTHQSPFRWMHKKDLIGLRDYVTELHNEEFNELHYRLQFTGKMCGIQQDDNTNLSMTEWDLLEIWRQQIDKQELNLQIIPYDIFYGIDIDRGLDYYINKNVRFSDEIAKKVLELSTGY